MELTYRQTGDGSFTCYSPRYDELYHGYAGAWLEAERVYFQGTGLITRAKEREHVSILDVGFGLGYNCLVALYNCAKINSKLKVTLVSLEIDREIVAFDKYPEIDSPLYPRLLNQFSQFKHRGYFISSQSDWRLALGDARETLPSIEMKFDAIFLDPFSHTKNPELWTVDFCQILYQKLNDDGILATYSVATPVRSGLIKAGFFVSVGIGTPSKKSSTVADKIGRFTPISAEERAKLDNSPYAVPYKDPLLSWSRERIRRSRESGTPNLQKVVSTS